MDTSESSNDENAADPGDNNKNQLDLPPPKSPFKEFLGILSFAASIGIALSITGSQTLAGSISFMGRSDNTTMASVQYSALMFTWAASMYGLGLGLSLAHQLLVTSDNVERAIWDSERNTKYQAHVKWILVINGWASLGFIVAATCLVGEGLKVASVVAGSILQWGMLVIAVPKLLLLAHIEWPARKEKNKRKKKKNNKKKDDKKKDKNNTKSTCCGIVSKVWCKGDNSVDAMK